MRATLTPSRTPPRGCNCESDPGSYWTSGQLQLTVQRAQLGQQTRPVAVTLSGTIAGRRNGVVWVSIDPCTALPDGSQTTPADVPAGTRFVPGSPTTFGRQLNREFRIKAGKRTSISLRGIASARDAAEHNGPFWTDCVEANLSIGPRADDRGEILGATVWPISATLYASVSATDGRHFPCGPGGFCPTTRPDSPPAGT